jgi:hypothetical protein
VCKAYAKNRYEFKFPRAHGSYFKMAGNIYQITYHSPSYIVIGEGFAV